MAEHTKPTYHTLEQAVGMIEEPNRTCCNRLLKAEADTMRQARGSVSNHQYWPGGYLEHITETMNIAIALYRPLDSRRELEFSLSDALLVLFLHDIEKPWKYIQHPDGSYERKPEMKSRENVKRFAEAKIAEYGFRLSDDHRNGLKYAEGEIDEWTPGKRLMKPLAAFVHMCDVWSARGWYDQPKRRASW